MRSLSYEVVKSGKVQEFFGFPVFGHFKMSKIDFSKILLGKKLVKLQK
jgi:hypothetical protein